MNRLTLIATSFLLFMTFTIQAQEAHRKYNTTVSQIEKQPDSRSKSEERGKALAIFYDSRIIEAGSETAKTETATIFRQLIDYDFLAAYNFLMKIKKQDDALLFTKSYMSQQERTMIRTVASHTVSNVNTTTSPSYPANIPQPGYGVKGKWNSGTLTANTTNANNNAVVQTQTNNGATEVKRVYNAEQTKNLPVLELKPFKNHNGKWGFKDDKNIIIVQPKYNSSHQFREGLAAVSIGGSYDEEFDMVLGSKYGFIDNTGKEVIALKYESINDGFYEGLAAVKLNGKWGYINTAGNEVIPFQYSEAFIFMNGKAKVRKDGREFFIDKTGKEVK